MIKKNMQDALNAQLNREIYSAYLYLSMAAYFESINLKGFANWMAVQRQEEASVDDVVKKLALMSGAPGGIFLLDRELAQRVFTPPPAAGAAGWRMIKPERGLPWRVSPKRN